MNQIKSVCGIVCLALVSFATGCGTAAKPASVATPSNAASSRGDSGQEAEAMKAARPATAEEVWLGPTRGELTDPEGHAWQAELLHAMGRDGQYALFDCVIVESKGIESLYVGVNATPLTLTEEQSAAVREVQAKYAKGSIGASNRGGLLLARMAVEPRQVADAR